MKKTVSGTTKGKLGASSSGSKSKTQSATASAGRARSPRGIKKLIAEEEEEERKRQFAIQKAEINQLESFVKKRAKEVDMEIEALREKVKARTGGTLPPTTGKGTTRTGLPPGSSNAKYMTGSIENDSISHLANSTPMEMKGKALGRVELDPHQLMEESRQAAATMNRQTRTLQKEVSKSEQVQEDIMSRTLDGVQSMKLTDDRKQQLIAFLAKLRLKAEDAHYTGGELRDLLLPPDMVVNGEYLVPLDEVTSILQSDLLFPVTKQDQMMMLDEYGNDMKEIDVKIMLQEAGIWEDDYTEGGRDGSPMGRSHGIRSAPDSPDLHEVTRQTRASLDNTGSSRPPVHPHDITTKAEKNMGDQRQVFQHTSNTLQELNDLHNLVLDERDYDDPSTDPILKKKYGGGRNKGDGLDDDELQLHLLASRHSEKHHRDKDNHGYEDDDQDRLRSVSSSPDRTSSKNPTAPKTSKPTLAVDDLLVVDDETVRKLAQENKRLKEEMQQFDSNFFEELEDLKFRYAKLQEYVGEDPAAAPVSKLLSDPRIKRNMAMRGATDPATDGGPPVKDGLPLSKLGWSVRDSMRAMDRAAYDSALVAGPRMAHAYTYAPGGRGRLDQTDMLNMQRTSPHIGGSIPSAAIKREYKDYYDFSHDPDMVDVAGRPLGALEEPGGDTLFRSRSNTRALLQSTRGSGGERTIVDGGVHGIGAGKYNFPGGADMGEGFGSFANLCERRLAFEISTHPKSTDVVNVLIHKVVDFGEKNKIASKAHPDDKPFVTVPQIISVISGLGLSISIPEIEMLASGFASDGEGGIDVKEFCEMIHSLLYNILGEHSKELKKTKTSLSSSGRGKGSTGRGGPQYESKPYDEEDDDEDDEALRRSNTFKLLMKDLCDGIITFDKKAVLGTSNNIFNTLLKMFVEVDFKGSGLVSFDEFVVLLKDMGAMFSYEESQHLARPYAIPPRHYVPESSYPSSNLNHLDQFRERKLTGSLNGRSKVKPGFGEFLSNHGLEDVLEDQENERKKHAMTGNNAKGDFPIEDDTMIQYPPFVKDLADMLEDLLDERGGLPMNPRLPWVLKEFEFVDVLMTQLEAMNAVSRRKTLITLQYAFENADLKRTGELDGFAFLTALMNSGFRLQRFQRVQLLKAAEEYGGQLEYARLILTLLQTAVDWTQAERGIVQKILKSMGVTVSERRNWLAKLKKELMERTSRNKLKQRAKSMAVTSAATAKMGKSKKVDPNETKKRGHNLLDLTQTTDSNGGLFPDDDNDMIAPPTENTNGNIDLVIPPSTFLHVLRDMNVLLTPEEEAILLDCLDTERIAKLQAIRLTSQMKNDSDDKHGNNSGKNSSKFGLSIHEALWGKKQEEEFTMPMIDYQSFILYCGRHCGSWIDSKPHLYDRIMQSIESLQFPLQSLQEFLSLLRSFDENNRQYVSYRAFLICCHRARLLSGCNEKEIEELANTLAIDGAGEIEYKSFGLQLRGIVSSISMHSCSDTSLSLVNQLLYNGTNNNNNGTQILIPIRNWLIMHSDIQSCLLTIKEFNALLREFSVIYKPDDIELIYFEIGKEIDLDEDNPITSDITVLTGSSKGITWKEMIEQDDMIKGSRRRARVIDTKKLLFLLMRSRYHWTERNPKLVRSLLAILRQLQDGQEQLLRLHATSGSNNNNSNNSNTKNITSTKISLETLILDKIITRINAFGIDNIEQENVNPFATVPNRPDAMISTYGKRAEDKVILIEKFIFDYLLKSMGIYLSSDDLQFLADCSDPLPEANRINPYLLLDLVKVEDQDKSIRRHSDSNHANSEIFLEEQHLSSAAIFALNQIKEQLWKVWKLSKRTVLEWIADIKCLYEGFDTSGQGLITFDDFVMGLVLLNLRISVDLLMDIPYINRGYAGDGQHSYVQYRKVLAYVLVPPDAPKDEDGSGIPSATIGETNDKDNNTIKKHMTVTKKSLEPTLKQTIMTLIRLVRKRMSKFIISEKNTEEAWLEMLRVFERFDPTQSNTVKPRDFCLAVSVLLQEDDVAFTKEEWEEVIEYFADPLDTKKLSSTRSTRNGTHNNSKNELRVNYMIFCEMVLDPSEVDKKIKELNGTTTLSHTTSTSANEHHLDRSKRLLSGTPNSRKTMASTASNGAEKNFQAEIVGTGTRSSRGSSTPSKPAKEDPIVKRFQDANDKYNNLIRMGKSYGEHTETTTGDDGYRTSRTNGQSSRDAAANRSKALSSSGNSPPPKPRPLSATISGTSTGSHKQTYASSHKSRTMPIADKLSQSKVRFNWDPTDE